MTNQAEPPATGIFKRAEYPDSVWYEVPCECGSDEHRHSLWIEVDDEVAEVIVNLYTTATTDYWSTAVDEYISADNPFARWYGNTIAVGFNSLIRRIRIAWSALFRGYVKHESHVILSRQQAINYANALAQAVDRLDQQRKAKNDQ